MTDTITLLIVVLASGPVHEGTYPDAMTCGDNLPGLHVAMEREHDEGYLYSQCVRTGAPSRVTIRPEARPE
jgi:hypothetical protein